MLLAISMASAYFSFNYFVRSGVTTVPELEGLSPEESAQAAAVSGLRLEWTAEAQHHESIAPGHVVRQRPRPGSLVKRGAVIRAVPSLGQEVIAVPDVTDRALQAAQVTLAAKGLSVGAVANVYSDGGPPGTVVDQNPPPGARAARGQKVDLFLSLEERSAVFVMPDLIYRDYDEVRQYFARRNVRLGGVKFEDYEGIAHGVILRQYPQPGHALRESDVVSLVVTADGTAS